MDDVKKTVHGEALERFDKAEQFEKVNRELADEDLRFAAGEHWPEDIRRQRERANRPCLTNNRLPAFIAQVVGDARQNKPAIKVHPVDSGSDPEIAELYEGLIRHIETASSAPVAYLTAFEHACTGGFGHWRILTDYCDDDSFDQEIKIKRIQNPFSVYWDDNAKEVDKSDAEWCFVEEMMTKEAFASKYPKDAPTDWEGEFVGTDFNGWLTTENQVRVVEYWRKKHVKRTIYQLYDGSVVDEVPEGEVAFREREAYTSKIERYVLSGKGILEGPEEWPGKHIPIVTITGPEEWVSGRVQYRSIIRYAKDPSRMYNYWQTAITEKIALAPKAPWLVSQKEVEGLEHYWAASNVENRAYLPFNPDPVLGGRPARNQPAAINSAEIHQAQQSIDDIKATTGIHDASLGNQGNETSGRAILARQREGDTATFAWIDNLARGINRTGRIIIDLIPKIYDAERTVRILGEDGTSEMMDVNQPNVDAMGMIHGYLNDLTVGKYDITVTTGPSYSTKRIEAAESMMQFIQAFPAAAPLAGDLIAKAMDWPGADEIAERLKSTIPPEILNEEKTPEEMQAMQEQMAQQQQLQQEQLDRERQSFDMDMKVKMAEIREKMANAAKDIADAEAQDIENDATESGIAQLMERLNGQAE